MSLPERSKIGVIDIGSNSVRLVIFDVFGAAFTPVYNEKILAGLGRDLQITGKLSPEGKEQTLAALQRFKLIAKAQNLHKVLIAATAAMRTATDAPDFIKTVRKHTGFDISPLSGRKEALYSAYGVLAGEPRAEGLAADLGGASLELIMIRGNKVDQGISLPLGPFAVYQGDFDAKMLRPKIMQVLDNANLDTPITGKPLYLIGGAWRNLGLIHQARTGYPLRVAQNYTMDNADAKELALWAGGEGAQALLRWPGIYKRRAETLPYAGLILDILLEKLGSRKIVIAPGGLREGILYTSFPPSIKRRSALEDACRDLASGNEQGRNFGRPLQIFLRPFSDHWPGAFEPDNETRLRQAACRLVGIGKGMHPDHRAQLVFETVLYAPLPGLTHKERAYLALMLFASYTSKKTIPNKQAIDHFLSEEDCRIARGFGEAMRLAVVVSGRSASLLSKFTLYIRDKMPILDTAPGYEALLQSKAKTRYDRLVKVMAERH